MSWESLKQQVEEKEMVIYSNLPEGEVPPLYFARELDPTDPDTSRLMVRDFTQTQYVTGSNYRIVQPLFCCMNFDGKLFIMDAAVIEMPAGLGHVMGESWVKVLEDIVTYWHPITWGFDLAQPEVGDQSARFYAFEDLMTKADEVLSAWTKAINWPHPSVEDVRVVGLSTAPTSGLTYDWYTDFSIETVYYLGLNATYTEKSWYKMTAAEFSSYWQKKKSYIQETDVFPEFYVTNLANARRKALSAHDSFVPSPYKY